MELILPNANFSFFLFFFSHENEESLDKNFPTSKLKSFILVVFPFSFSFYSSKLKTGKICSTKHSYVIHLLPFELLVEDGTLETFYADFLSNYWKKLWFLSHLFWVLDLCLDLTQCMCVCLWEIIRNKGLSKLETMTPKCCTFEWPTAKCINANS